VTIDEAKAALQRLYDKHPHLTSTGFPFIDAGKMSWDKEWQRDHYKMYRQRLLDNPEMFIACCDYVASQPRRQRPNYKDCSLARRSKVVRWREDRGDPRPYVMHGMLIAACLHLGVKVSQCSRGSEFVSLALGAHREWADCAQPTLASLPDSDDLSDLLG
jgi:hypothetical protein